jgi:hypothetical protein
LGVERVVNLKSGDDGNLGRLQLDYASPPPSRQVRPLTLVAIGVAAVFAGAIVGASTNAVNGAVSPTYFIVIMGWDFEPNVWLASVVQGVLEGSVVGFLFSVILTMTIGIITRATCTLRIGMRWLGRIVLAIYGAWLVGGICGVMCAATNPSFFRSSRFGYGGSAEEMLRFAWVRGSIWGAEPGGLLVLIGMLIWFGISWRREIERERGGTTERVAGDAAKK